MVTAENTGRGRARLYADGAHITILVDENPGREGTASYKHFETAKAAGTVGEYRAAGGNLRYLYWLKGRGKIAIES